MQRIVVRGASGSGKTTLAKALAERLGVPHVELDALHHGPDWQEATAEELRARVEPLVAGEAWVVDGNYERKLGDLVLERADTVVWLDLPLRVTLPRLWRRTRRRIRGEEELWNGNRESWRTAVVGRESLFVWTIRRHGHYRSEEARRETLRRHPHLDLVHLRSAAEVERWLRGVLTGP